MSTLPVKLPLYLTGGSSNTDPALSLGGQISTKVVRNQKVTGTPPAGVTIDYAHSNPLGDGSLLFKLPQAAVTQVSRIQSYSRGCSPAPNYNLAVKINGVKLVTSDTYGTQFLAYDSPGFLRNLISTNTALNNAISIGTAMSSGQYVYFDLTSKQTGTPFTIEVLGFCSASTTANGPFLNNASLYCYSADSVTLTPNQSAISANSIAWQAYGESVGSSVTIANNGQYELPSGTVGKLIVTVNTAQVPTAASTATLTVGAYSNETMPDLIGIDSYFGKSTYVCYAFKNNDTIPHMIKLYIANQPTGGDTIAVGVDPAGVGNGTTTGIPQVIADIYTAPTGVTFSSPTTANDAISLGTLQPGQAIAWWQRRSIPAGERAGVTNNTSNIGIYMI